MEHLQRFELSENEYTGGIKCGDVDKEGGGVSLAEQNICMM